MPQAMVNLWLAALCLIFHLPLADLNTTHEGRQQEAICARPHRWTVLHPSLCRPIFSSEGICKPLGS